MTNEHVRISKKLVLINSISSMATMVLGTGVSVWIVQYLLKRISVEEYSLLPVLTAVMMAGPIVIRMFTVGLSRFVTDAYARGENDRVTQIVSSMVPFTTGVGLLVTVGAVILALNIEHLLNIDPARVEEARLMLVILAVPSAIGLFAAPFTMGLYVRQKFVFMNVIGLATTSLRAALLFVLLFGVSTRVMWVVVATAAAHVCQIAINVFVSRRLIHHLRFRPSQFRLHLARRIMAFGGWNLLGELSWLIREASGPLILNKLALALDVNCYHVGAVIDRQIRAFMHQATLPLHPPITAMHSTGQSDRLRSSYVRGGRYGLWLSLMIALPIVVYRDELMRLYLGVKFSLYRDTATVMLLLLLIYPFMYARTMLESVAQATAKLRTLKTLQFGFQIVNLLLAVYLVGVAGMGAVGVALSTLIIGVINYGLADAVIALAITGGSARRLVTGVLVPGYLPGLALAGVAELCRRLLQPDDLWTLAVCACVALLSFLLAAWFCMQPEDRRDMKTLFDQLADRFGRGG